MSDGGESIEQVFCYAFVKAEFVASSAPELLYFLGFNVMDFGVQGRKWTREGGMKRKGDF